VALPALNTAPLRWATRVDFFRGTPAGAIFMIYFGIPALLQGIITFSLNRLGGFSAESQ